MVTSVSGLLTKPGLGVWATEPDGSPPLIADLARSVAAATDVVEVVRNATGPATVASWTVTHQGQEPFELVAIVDLEAGGRAVARSDDSALMDRAMADGIVGMSVAVDDGRLIAWPDAVRDID